MPKHQAVSAKEFAKMMTEYSTHPRVAILAGEVAALDATFHTNVKHTIIEWHGTPTKGHTE
jgi:hypothetical protein